MRAAKIKICPQCGAREVDYNCQICSECRTINDYLSVAKSQARPESIEARREYCKAYVSPPVGLVDPFRRDASEEQIKKINRQWGGLSGLSRVSKTERTSIR